MALQLSYYRLYKTSCPTYESASTRPFLHGRTETIRVCSEHSVAFTKNFDREDVSTEQKRELLIQAIQNHTKLTVEASAGHGVDRHLLGLRIMASPEELKQIKLFTDPSYIKGMSFKLSCTNIIHV